MDNARARFECWMKRNDANNDILFDFDHTANRYKDNTVNVCFLAWEDFFQSMERTLHDYRVIGADAVRLSPSSYVWSQELRRLFGPNARDGIDSLERQLHMEIANQSKGR